MPSIRIPLVFPFSARTWAKTIGSSSKDAQAINVLYEIANNSQLNTKSIYPHKRPGSSTSTTFASGVRVLQHYSSHFDAYLFSTSTAFYKQDATVLGTLTDQTKQQQLGEAVIGSTGVLAWVTNDEKGWFLYSDAISTNFPTFSGDRTSGSPIITNIASTTGIYKGQAVSGTGIPADTRVLSVDSSTQITLNKNATSGAPTTTTITKEAIAQITDSDFPTDATDIVALGGYFFVGSAQGRIYNSALNDPATWVSTDFVSTDYFGDTLHHIFKVGQYIVGAGDKNGLQYYYIGGTTSGSVLSAANNLNVNIIVRGQPCPFSTGGFLLGKGPSPDVASGLPGLYRLTGSNSYQILSDNIIGGIIESLQLNHVEHANIGNRDLVIIRGDDDATFLYYDESCGCFGALSFSAAPTGFFGTRFTKSGSSTAFILDPTLFQDSGVAYTMTLISEPFDGGTMKNKTLNSLSLVADNEASGTASISWSDDDGANFSTARTVDMTVIDKRLDACGQFRRRIFKVEHSANTDFRAQALDLDYTVNAS